MADLAVALSKRGYRVAYVAQRAMSDERAAQGWRPPVMPGVVLQFAESDDAARELVQQVSAGSIHICQGVRANGMVRATQMALEARGLQQWVVMETVDDSGWRGAIKRIEYSRIFRARWRSIQGVLANGQRTAEWVNARGVPKNQIFPFAYFLPKSINECACQQRQPGPFRFIFAGQLIPRKRVDWLVNALAGVTDKSFELWVVGAGPKESVLKTLAAGKLGNRVRWLGQLPLPEVPAVMAQADCLVLPSAHDGWGAVASEALMAGTPVVCSDACGVAGVVANSGCGGVFPVENLVALIKLLAHQLAQGPVQASRRQKIANWALCLGASAGAKYLHEILAFDQHRDGERPAAPWNNLGVSL